MGYVRRRSRRLELVSGAVLASLAFAACAHWSVGGETVALWVDDLATVGAALLAAALCLRAAARCDARLRRFWLLLGAAAGAWALAEGTWGVYDLLVGDVPVVSLADVGYLAAIPLAIAALVSHPALHGSPERKARTLLDGLTVAVALLFLSWTLVLGPLWESADTTTLEGVVALSYPVGDVVLLFFVVLAVRGMTRGDCAPLWCLLGGLLAMSLSDTLYAYLTGVKDFDSGGALDAGWFAGYLGIALGAALAQTGRAELVVAAAEDPDPDAAAPPPASLVAPFLPLLLALTTLGVQVQLGERPDAVGLTLAFALLALALVRQVLLLREWSARPLTETRA